MKKIMNAVVAASLFLGGCDVSPDSELPSEVKQEIRGLDGEALYTGLFFGLGPAASLLPEVHALVQIDSQPTPEVLSSLQEAADKLKSRGDIEGSRRIHAVIHDVENGRMPTVDASLRQISARMLIAEIKANYPDFFVEFELAIHSGDPHAIDDAMGRAAELTAEARAGLEGSTEADLLKEQGFILAAAIVAAGVVAFVLAVYSGVVIVEGLWVVTNSANGNENGENSLLRDEIVARIAANASR